MCHSWLLGCIYCIYFWFLYYLCYCVAELIFSYGVASFDVSPDLGLLCFEFGMEAAL